MSLETLGYCFAGIGILLALAFIWMGIEVALLNRAYKRSGIAQQHAGLVWVVTEQAVEKMNNREEGK